LTRNNYSPKEFCNNIWQYNAIFAITTVKVKIDNLVTRQSDLYCFKIQGELHYYILDTAKQLNVKRLNNRNLNPMMIDNLQTMLWDNYLYIGYYCHTYELIREKPVEKQEEITIRLHVNLQQDQRTHNLLTAEYYTVDNRDMVLQVKEG